MWRKADMILDIPTCQTRPRMINQLNTFVAAQGGSFPILSISSHPPFCKDKLPLHWAAAVEHIAAT
jgi:hypothetical protein